MDYTAALAIQEHLQPNERLIWAGQPRKGILIRPVDAFLIPFSLLWGGFAIIWTAIALLSEAPLVFVLFGIPFVVVGLILIFGRFIIDAQQRKNTYYGLTKDRALVLTGIVKKSIVSVPISSLDEISHHEHKDSEGTILFGPQNLLMSWGGMSWWPGYTMPLSFYMIPDAKKVYQKILDLQKAGTDEI